MEIMLKSVSKNEDFPMMFLEIDDLRGHQENTASWQCRRRFLQIHWGRYPLEKLNQLSYCYTNIHMYGCDYSKAVMKELSPLAIDVAETAALDNGDFGVVISKNYLKDIQECKKHQLHEEFKMMKVLQQLRSETKKLNSKPEEIFGEIEMLSSEEENGIQTATDVGHQIIGKKTKSPSRYLEDGKNESKLSKDLSPASVILFPMTAQQWLLSEFFNRGQEDDGDNHQRHIPSRERHISSVERYIPSVERHIPSVERHIPSVERHIPSVERHIPSVERHIPSVERHTDAGKHVYTTARQDDHPPIKVGSSNNILLKSEECLVPIVTHESTTPDICRYHGSCVIEGCIPDDEYYMKGKRVYHESTAHSLFEAGCNMNGSEKTDRTDSRQCLNTEEEQITQTQVSKKKEMTLKLNSGQSQVGETDEQIQDNLSATDDIHVHENKLGQYVESRERNDKKVSTRSKQKTVYMSKVYQNSYQKKMLCQKVIKGHDKGHRMVKKMNFCTDQVDKNQRSRNLAVDKVSQLSEHSSIDQCEHVKLPYRLEKGHLQKSYGTNLTCERVYNAVKAESQFTTPNSAEIPNTGLETSQTDDPGVKCLPSAVTKTVSRLESIHRAQKTYIQLQKNKTSADITETIACSNSTDNGQMTDEEGVNKRRERRSRYSLGVKGEKETLIKTGGDRVKGAIKLGSKRKDVVLYSYKLFKKYSGKRDFLCETEDRSSQRINMGNQVLKGIPREQTHSHGDINTAVVKPKEDNFGQESVRRGEFIVPNVNCQRKGASHVTSDERKIYQCQQNNTQQLSSVVSTNEMSKDHIADTDTSMSVVKIGDGTKRKGKLSREEDGFDNASSTIGAEYKVSYDEKFNSMNFIPTQVFKAKFHKKTVEPQRSN